MTQNEVKRHFKLSDVYVTMCILVPTPFCRLC